MKDFYSAILLGFLLIFSSFSFANHKDEIVSSTLILEAGGEKDLRSLHAIMNVIDNRSKHDPAAYWTVCMKRYQFSCWNSVTVDGADIDAIITKTKRHPKFSDALELVKKSREGKLENIVEGAQFYYAKTGKNKIPPPKWSQDMIETITIGNHVFLREKKKGE